MKRRVLSGAAHWLFLIISLLLLGSVVGLGRFHAVSVPSGSREHGELEAEKARLSIYGEAALSSLRQDLARLEEGRGASPEIPAGWRSQAVELATGSHGIRYSCEGPTPSWEKIVHFVARVERYHGVDALLIESGGTRRRREIERVQIVVPAAQPRVPLAEPRGPP